MSQLQDAPSTQQTQPRAQRQRRPKKRYTPGTDALGKGKTRSSKQWGIIWVVHIYFMDCLFVLFCCLLFCCLNTMDCFDYSDFGSLWLWYFTCHLFPWILLMWTCYVCRFHNVRETKKFLRIFSIINQGQISCGRSSRPGSHRRWWQWHRWHGHSGVTCLLCSLFLLIWTRFFLASTRDAWPAARALSYA